MKCIEKGAFSECKNMTTITLVEGLECIESNAFYNDINLNTVVLPNSIKYVDNNAFPKSVAVIKPTKMSEILTRKSA